MEQQAFVSPNPQLEATTTKSFYEMTLLDISFKCNLYVLLTSLSFF